jgi:hypothetical protein
MPNSEPDFVKNPEENLARQLKFAKSLWGNLPRCTCQALKDLLRKHHISVIDGDVRYLNSGWYVTHSGLLRIAGRRRCAGIQVRPLLESVDPASSRWVFEATVFKSRGCLGFVGYGDADPSNVSPLFHGAEMRVAETRAVNRALRKAYGIGVCSVEELGATSSASVTSETRRRPPRPPKWNGWGSGPRLRDRLCQLIRQHQLDPQLVKAYAVDFCGVKTLKEASRAQVEAFVEQLADWAEKDRNALLCQLKSYFRMKEAQNNQEPKQEGAA